MRLCQDELDLQARANVVQGSGARAFGMGGAFLARADDATAASWNPAGISYLRRPEVSLVWTGRNRLDSIERAPTGEVVENDHRDGNAPDFLALTFPFEHRSITGAAQLSFQRVIGFDSSRSISRPAQQLGVDSSGGFDVLSLGTGLHLLRSLRLGITFNHWMNGYSQSLDKTAQITRNDGSTFLRRTQQDSDTTFSGNNVNLGLIWSPWENLNLGAVAKTHFTGAVGLGRFRRDTDEGGVITFNGHEESDLSIAFPGAIGVGASWRPQSPLTLSMDFTRTYWSDGKIYNFFTLPRRLPGAPSPPLEVNTDVFPVLPYPSVAGQQEDSEQIRAGAEYVLILGRVKIPLRGGYFDDRQYFRDGDGHVPHLHGVTAGTGLILGPMLLDVAYVHETGSYRAATVPAADGTPRFDRINISSSRVYLSLIYRKE